MIELGVEFISDDKGYWDRECPQCKQVFKVNLEDWKEKLQHSKEVHCPFCNCIAPNDSWWTQDQIEAIQDRAENFAKKLIRDRLDHELKKLTRLNRRSSPVQIIYKPLSPVTFINSPIPQREAWEVEVKCEHCGTRYSVIGNAYFCPCCGHNSIENTFFRSLKSIENRLNSLSDIEQALIPTLGKNEAKIVINDLLERLVGEIVSTFQSFICKKCESLSGKTFRVNDFQIIEKGNSHLHGTLGQKYENWLTEKELRYMEIMFQRRHLLEHNAGIVDEKYLNKTRDSSYLAGQRIVVQKADVLGLLEIIRTLGSGIDKYGKEAK